MYERYYGLQERPFDLSPNSRFLFLSRKGSPVSRSQFFRLFKNLAKSIGLSDEKCHPHILKHSLGTHLANAYGHDAGIAAFVAAVYRDPKQRRLLPCCRRSRRPQRPARRGIA